MLNFDDWLTRYTVSGFLLITLFSGLFLLYILKGRPSNSLQTGLWVLVFLGLLLFMRYPFIAYNQELDIDESQMIAQALSLKKYWIYWKYVDGLTQGPLASYLLIVPTWLGMSFDYTSARLLGYVLLSLTLIATFLTFRNLFGLRTGLIVFAPVAFFYLFSQGPYSTLYNEYVVLCLLGFCFWFFSILYKQEKPTWQILFLIGLLSGMVPFAKLQGVPTAILIVVFSAMILYSRSLYKIRDSAALVTGGLAFPLLVLWLSIRYEAFDYFWKFYLKGNLEYSSGGSILLKALNFLVFLRQSAQFSYLLFTYFLSGFCAVLVLLRYRTSLKSFNMILFFGLFQVIIAFYAIIKSGYLFPHYLQFLIIPTGILAGSMIHLAMLPLSWNFRGARLVAWFWMLVCMLPHLVNKYMTVNGFSSIGYEEIGRGELGKPLVKTPVSQEILKYALPGEDITIWGWYPAYHLETGFAQGTADNQSYRLLTPSPKQKSYRAKYMADLNRSKPVVFVDQVTDHSEWFNDPSLYKFERIPALRTFIATHYDLVSTINGERIFVRKDRLLTSRFKSGTAKNINTALIE